MPMPDYMNEALQLAEYTRTVRRDFHQNPELSFQEVRTSGVVARELDALGLEITTGIAKTGVVALLEGDHPGPVVLLRFDMDALPIQEENEVDYASQTAGVMHACGHDGHMAIGLTVARLLNAHRHDLRGTVKFVFQPAEENLGGAQQMVAEGVLENPRPDLSLSMHLWNGKPLGWLGISSGPVMAAADEFTLRIIGKGGHGALPHLTHDPILASAQVINALQGIVSRNVSPLETAVLSIATVHGGEAFNVIPSQVEMRGTIRTYNPVVRGVIVKRLEETARGVAAAMGCEVEIDVKSVTLAVVNDPNITQTFQETVRRLFPESELDTGYRMMASDDMCFLMQDPPGCYIFVGSANPEKGLDYSHHHPRFNIDEDALPKAVALMAAAATSFLV